MTQSTGGLLSEAGYHPDSHAKGPQVKHHPIVGPVKSTSGAHRRAHPFYAGQTPHLPGGPSCLLCHWGQVGWEVGTVPAGSGCLPGPREIGSHRTVLASHSTWTSLEVASWTFAQGQQLPSLLNVPTSRCAVTLMLSGYQHSPVTQEDTSR